MAGWTSSRLPQDTPEGQGPASLFGTQTVEEGEISWIFIKHFPEVLFY